jgi:hypothetical protein
MPFPDDQQIMKTAQGLVEGFQGIFGKHPGMRPGQFPSPTGESSINELPS